MMFGLEETEREYLDYNVRRIFEELKKKPLFRAERVGRKTSEDSDRPVKVSMDSCFRHSSGVTMPREPRLRRGAPS